MRRHRLAPRPYWDAVLINERTPWPLWSNLGFCSSRTDNDNDNDNDTLREVPHRSNEGLALQARVSGPWPHKKESVLQVKLALLARCKYKPVVDRV